eukprot:TRINITY_DN24397_c0_g1_i1.p1 TRINITY_DN24397_c0_g1~~TRINITY_DN24397_c0_g1_i1.p1  ORF type:complete len:550 (-),score=100.08 TRINITY_DN24397_c0_g1_i1:127-1776(-)
MPSLDDEAVAEVFGCGICEDILLDPITLSCCGRSFCKGCLQTWIKTNVRSTGIPRCPGGCSQKIPYRLPKHSITLRTAVEQLFPQRLEERRREEADAEEDLYVGGFKAWEEVAASRDVLFANNAIGVRQGTHGIVVDKFSDGVHLTVKFDEREDGSDLCVNVIPEVLMHPLPGGLRLGQKVVAIVELILTPVMKIPLGAVGSIIGAGGGDRITVLFDPPLCLPCELEEQQKSFPYFPVSVSTRDVAPHRLLVGGFSIAQKVQSSGPLMVGSQTLVQAGCCGTVLGEFSDTRLTVLFENSAENPGCFNLLPHEIRPWCEPLDGFPVGACVMATHHLVSMEIIVAEAGARGIVLGCVDEFHVLVAMEGGRCLTIATSGLQCVQEQNPEEDMCNCPGREGSEQRTEELDNNDCLSGDCTHGPRPRIASDEETTVPEEDSSAEDASETACVDSPRLKSSQGSFESREVQKMQEVCEEGAGRNVGAEFHRAGEQAEDPDSGDSPCLKSSQEVCEARELARKKSVQEMCTEPSEVSTDAKFHCASGAEAPVVNVD